MFKLTFNNNNNNEKICIART